MIEKNIQSQLMKKEKILISNMMDKYKTYLKSKKSTYSNFLNPSELSLVVAYLRHNHIPYSIYEPYPFLEKKIIYFGNYDNFVTFYKMVSVKELTHQQVLGTLFSIGLNDNMIGDIFIEKGICYYTNLSKLNSFLEKNLTVIGKEQVKLIKVEEILLEEEHFDCFTVLVNSMRLDNIVSKITSQSRRQVEEMLLEKRIVLNYKEIKSASIVLKENDIISIRRVGKFKIGKQEGFTKKENIILKIYKYR